MNVTQQTVRPGPIDGVQEIPLVAHCDDRGYLIEILRQTDPHFTGFGQVYLVGDLTAGTVRAFHKHEKLVDWFFIGHGHAKFILVDDRPQSPTFGHMSVHTMGTRNPALLVVPTGVFHGWMALEDDTQLISIASTVYNRDNPDEERISPDTFGDVWTIKGR